ncbi:MAG TPA: TonB-dependent receptor, partial [Candidatus Baltobacteraceae bacterium]
MIHLLPRRLGVALLTFSFAFAYATCTPVAASGAFLSGTVTSSGRADAGVTITVSGDNIVAHATTDAYGRFIFSSLQLGTYTVVATAAGLHAEAHVDLGSGGVTFALSLKPLEEIAKVTVVSASVTRGSGADVALNATFLTRSPASDSFPEVLIQLPGAARGANGVVHVNGDHGVIDYLIDGVPLPQALNREVGSEIDPSDIAFLDVIEGAYPAQYGLRFGSILNITTRSGAGPAGLDGTLHYGSYGNVDQTIGYHAPLGNGGGYDVAIRNEQTDRALDPPTFSSPHNDGSDANQFARVTLAGHNNTFMDLTLIHSFQTFEIPDDTHSGEPATTDDDESQDDTFVNLQVRRMLGPNSALSFGPALKVSHIRDYGDPAGDWAYGEALNTAPPPFGNGGTAGDCADALSAGNFGPTTCAFSLGDDKTSLDSIMQADYVSRVG